MSNEERLSVPPELQHLIEKRQQQDRRKDRRSDDTGPPACDRDRLDDFDSVEDQESLVVEDPSFEEERQKNWGRRRTDRRKEDDAPTTDR